MADIPSDVLLKLLLFLSFPFIGGYLATKLKISPLIGYIVGGVFLKIIVGDKLPKEFLSQFSMLGLVFLVFTIGLETNFSHIRKFGKFVLTAGLLQLVLSGIIIFVFSLIFKFNLTEALFFGMAFTTSSTAIVAKIIQDRGEENSLLGGLAIGILVLQDISLIPILIISTSFSNTNLSWVGLAQTIIINMIKAGFVLGVVYYLGRKIIPLIFNKLAKVSRDILNLFTIIFIIAFLFLFALLQLSSLLVAFLIGVLLGQTLENQHIFSQIRPFRDILMIVFFVFLGLTIEPLFIFHNFFKIILFTSLIVFTKFTVILILFLFLKFHSRTAFSLGIFLFQIGEGAFVVIYQGLSNGAINQNTYLFAVSSVILTLVLTPFLISKKDIIYAKIKTFISKKIPVLDKFITYRLDREIPSVNAITLKDHIVICGYGRVGKYIGRALMLADIPFIAIDYNFHVVEKAKKEGVNIIYGDPTEIDVLDYAEVEYASSLILALPERFSQEMIILSARRLNTNVVIFTRVHADFDQIRMKDLGVDVIVQPEFEASLSIIRKILLLKHVAKEDISGKIKRLKIEHGMI